VIRVLFVCLGNICRSPMAHGVLRDLVVERGLEGRIAVDSCGTSAYHNGEPPDSNMVAVAAKHGVRIADLRSRKLVASDYRDFELLVPMDGSNERDVQAGARGSDAEITRFTDFVPDDVFAGDGVPDPYYGGLEGFEQVYRIIVAGSERVLERALELEAE
jgi:protein-tyrosine phosphatase